MIWFSDRASSVGRETGVVQLWSCCSIICSTAPSLYIYTDQTLIFWLGGKPVSIWCDHHLPHAVQHIELIRLLIVACWMLVHSSSMAVKLLDIVRNWNTLLNTPIQSIPNMLNGWHVRWVCWSCKNWDVFRFQKLCTLNDKLEWCWLLVDYCEVFISCLDYLAPIDYRGSIYILDDLRESKYFAIFFGELFLILD